MIRLPQVKAGGVAGRRVLVRADLELAADLGQRYQATVKIIEFLRELGAARIRLIGHQGSFKFPGVEVVNDLRADPREEANDEGFAAELASGWEVYINEAFAASHRRHTSIVALPAWMKKQGRRVFCGPRFVKEVMVLNGVLNNAPSDPPLNLRGGRNGGDIKRVLVVGGAKVDDKAKCAEQLEKRGWMVLRGGLLPGAKLRPDGRDISAEAVVHFKGEIASAGVVVVAGPLGQFEDEAASEGTREVFTAVAASGGYKVAGGGDTEAAIVKFGLAEKFDWISVGGGAMLEFLATGTLPGIEALVSE